MTRELNSSPHTGPDRRRVLLGAPHYAARLQQLQTWLAARDLDGALFLHPANVMWASGFFHIPNERPIGYYVPASGAPVLFAPLLEQENAAEAGIADVRCYLEYPGATPAEVWMLDQIAADRIVVDAASHTLFTRLIARKPHLRMDDATVGLGALRYVKTRAEIELTRAAAVYADAGLEVARAAVAGGLRARITEIDVVQAVQSEITARMKRELDDLVNFYRGAVALTAHTGPRAALPHGQPGPVPIRPGNALIVGIGVKVGGYHAESGCTFVVGEPSRDQLRCLETTWACDQAAFDALRPGAACESVNAAAWAVLEEGSYGPFIRHRIGHGMGIEGHEAPWLAPGDATPLQPGMIFSNEPGIYRPGVDGYRIIDSMLVTENGAERLSRYLSEHGPHDRVIPV